MYVVPIIYMYEHELKLLLKNENFHYNFLGAMCSSE